MNNYSPIKGALIRLARALGAAVVAWGIQWGLQGFAGLNIPPTVVPVIMGILIALDKFLREAAIEKGLR